MPPLRSGLTRESAKNVMTRQNTPMAEMPQAVSIAQPLAPPAAASPDSENTPAPTMSVMTVVTIRNKPMPLGLVTPSAAAWGTEAPVVVIDSVLMERPTPR